MDAPFEEIDVILEINEIEIINAINPEHAVHVFRERPDHINNWNDTDFYNRFRISKPTALLIHELIKDQIIHPTERNFAISPLLQLLITLLFYSAGSFYIVAGDFGGVHKSTAGKIIKRVTTALLSLKNKYIHLPETLEETATTKRKFYEISRFPRVIGAIDCTHIRLQCPVGPTAENFRNRKGYFSLNVQCFCNADYKITDIVARWPGSCHDSNIFYNSALGLRFEAEELGSDLILGDGGYPLRSYLLTPFHDPQNAAQHLYNESQIRTRTVIERTFGIWKRRFPILSVGMRCQLPLAQDIIVTTAILHNIARDNNEEEDFEVEIITEETVDNHLRDNQNNNIRNELVQYFSTLL